MNKILLAAITIFFSTQSFSQRAWYVSPSGNDTANTGSIDSPFLTIPVAVNAVSAGDTIYLRGGSHIYTGSASTIISIGKSGFDSARLYLYAYPGEQPILDFSTTAAGVSKGVKLSGGYWHFKGIDFYKAGNNGLIITGANSHNNIIEDCRFYENGNTGLQIENSANNDTILNCDSYFNVDATQGNADGFGPKLDVGNGIYFYGCRSWQNSDDGWDGYLNDNITDISTTLENCWCFHNGYLKDGSASLGNGNGFKLGGSKSTQSMHNFTVIHCLSFYNRVKGYDQNNNKGNITLYNCTSFSNGTNYGLNSPGGVNTAAGKQIIVKNCVSAGTGSITILSTAVQQDNSWLPPFTVDNTDFLSVDTTGVTGARQPDGSLPELQFMHLATGSDLIDGGVDVGLPFNGLAPDLGAFETQVPVPVRMLSFTAAINNNIVTLDWSMANEFNNKGWNIERAPLLGNNANQWQDIGFVKGAGNSSLTTSYSFVDNADLQGTFQYRLKQTDANGSITYSRIIIVRNNGNKELSVSGYPNPFKTSATIIYTIPSDGNIKLTLHNAQGQLIAVLSNGFLQKGTYQKLINTANLAGGKYILRLSNGEKVISNSILKVD